MTHLIATIMARLCLRFHNLSPRVFWDATTKQDYQRCLDCGRKVPCSILELKHPVASQISQE